MVIARGSFAVILISLVAVDRIKENHKAAVLEDKKKEKGIRYLLRSFLSIIN